MKNTNESPSTNLIFQYLITNPDLDKSRGPIEGRSRTEVYKEVAYISSESFQLYADEVGADYLYSNEAVYTKPHIEKDNCVPLFECLRVIYDTSFDKYDKVLFVDTDIVANTHENIFEASDAEVYGVLESDIRTETNGGYNTWDYDGSVYRQFCEKYEHHGIPLVPSLPPNEPSKLTVLNTGVVVWTRDARLRARELFDDWSDWYFTGPQVHMSVMNDQPYISGQLMKHDFDLGTLDQTWNDTPTHYHDPDGEKALGSNFLHYTGGGNKMTMIDQYNRGLFSIFS